MQIGHHGIEVFGSQRGIVMEAHRRLELAAVLADPCRDGTLDLGVGPRPDALGLALGDVARHRHAPRSLELEVAGAEPGLELADALLHRRMAFHAVGDGGEVEAVLLYTSDAADDLTRVDLGGC